MRSEVRGPDLLIVHSPEGVITSDHRPSAVITTNIDWKGLFAFIAVLTGSKLDEDIETILLSDGGKQAKQMPQVDANNFVFRFDTLLDLRLSFFVKKV